MNHKFRIPFIEQYQRTECGLNCVAMICCYYGHEIDIVELRDEMDVGRDGTNFLDLINLFERRGFDVKSYKIPNRKEDFHAIPYPSIALWETKHFIVIEKITNNSVFVIDPALGRLKYTYGEFKDSFSEYVIEAIPNNGFLKKKRKKGNSIIAKTIFSFKWEIISILLIYFIIYCINMGAPLLIGFFINNINENAFIYNHSVYFILLLTIILWIFLYFQQMMSLNLRLRIDDSLNKKVFSIIFSLPLKFFENRSKGDLLYAVNGLSSLREIFTNNLIMGVLDIFLAFSLIIYFFVLNPAIFIIVILLSSLNAFLLIFTKDRLDRNNKTNLILQNKLQNKQIETVYSMVNIKMDADEKAMYKSWKATFNKYLHQYKASQIYENRVNTTVSTMVYMSPFIITVLSFNIYFQNKMQLGSIITIYAYSALLFTKIKSIYDLSISLINSKAFVLRINDITNSEPENNKGEKINLKGNIELKNISFSYTKNSGKVIDDISFKLKEGEKIALVGSSGSGKSTLAKLLVSIYLPTSGKLIFENKNIDSIDLKDLRKQIGVIPQDITLFNKSIIDNLTGGLKYEHNEIIDACKKVNIHKEIMDMPMNYHTIISELGTNLSGGQRQRLLLAKVLLRKPKVILLDEATSYLDNINEKIIMDMIKNENITSIIIAHRLSTIEDADCIYLVEKGKIVEHGKHNELIKRKNGKYRLLYNSQEEQHE
ncbi:peptidase domain-containing ABC transporter [Staphylococcus simulans]